MVFTNGTHKNTRHVVNKYAFKCVLIRTGDMVTYNSVSTKSRWSVFGVKMQNRFVNDKNRIKIKNLKR